MTYHRWAVSLGLLVVWVLLGAMPPALADNLCKPAAPLPQSKCVKDAQCCSGLVCELSGAGRVKRCQPGCRIGGTFYPSGASNPANDCQSCQSSVNTAAWANKPNNTACDDGNACTQPDTCQEGACVGTVPVPTFVDNGDGTITDRQTCLVWEKKNGANGVADFTNPHDVDNTYTWTATFFGTAPDGTAFTDFLEKLNNRCADATTDCTGAGDAACVGIGNGLCGFAGHRDWRLPTSAGCCGFPTGEPAELESILLAPFPCGTSPCIDAIFGPTAARYWSSSTFSSTPQFAWFVDFDNGELGQGNKSIFAPYVRAVRGGP